MAYFRKLQHILDKLHSLLHSQENWLILINADPDAMACALALKRLISLHVKKVVISNINEISRPDNLAMIRLLRIGMVPISKISLDQFQRFALVDSQPHHSPDFDTINFDIVIDHHPEVPEFPVQAKLSLINPNYGACSTLFTELFYNAKIRMGKRLATAMQYGIRTDTASFGRRSTELDLRAYHFLSRFADHSLLMQIMRSEYLPEWLPHFAHAIKNLQPIEKGCFTSLETVKSPDILVVVADFFQKVHGVHWIAVIGFYQNKAIIVLRGNGNKDLGLLASHAFSSLGSAGGHKQMARAEIEITIEDKNQLVNSIYHSLLHAIKNGF